MKLMVSMASDSRISESLTNLVVKNFPQVPDLVQRLRMLELIKRQGQTNTGPKQTPHENAVALASEKGKLYIGYRIHKVNGRWACDVHSFVVYRGRVLDPTYAQAPNVTYVGMPVPAQDVADLRYLSLFDRFSYVRKNAPFALLES